MSKVVFEEMVGGNEWRLLDNGVVWFQAGRVLDSDGSRHKSHRLSDAMFLFAEAWRAEHWPRFAPLGEDETMLDGERVKFERALTGANGEAVISTRGGGALARIYPFCSFGDYWHPDTAEKAQAWWLANWQRPADEWFDREAKRVRKLRDDEGVCPRYNALCKFHWAGRKAKAFYESQQPNGVITSCWWPDPVSEKWEDLAARLESWARANLPAHLAIVDGQVVEMADDEARDFFGRLYKCRHWSLPNLDSYSWAPGQRKRVEKWRASQHRITRAQFEALSKDHEASIIREIQAEREKQHAKWGVQNHPFLSGKAKLLIVRETIAKSFCQAAEADGSISHAHIIIEELTEAIEASTPENARAELVQLAACVVQAIASLDRNGK